MSRKLLCFDKSILNPHLTNYYVLHFQFLKNITKFCSSLIAWLKSKLWEEEKLFCDSILRGKYLVKIFGWYHHLLSQQLFGCYVILCTWKYHRKNITKFSTTNFWLQIFGYLCLHTQIISLTIVICIWKWSLFMCLTTTFLFITKPYDYKKKKKKKGKYFTYMWYLL
jgi:hypothetical protein